MKETRVATRYAASLLDLALEQNALEKVNEDMWLIKGAIKGNRDLSIMLQSPLIKADKKNEILSAVFKGKVNDLTLSFLSLLAKKRRESKLEQIVEEFHDLYNRHKGIQMAIVTTAVGLDENLRKKVLDMIKAQTNSEIALVEKIDKDLIGGFTIQIGDKKIDSSIVRSLKSLKRELGGDLYKKSF